MNNNELFAELDDFFNGLDLSDVVSVKDKSTHELVDRLAELNTLIKERKTVLSAAHQEDRDLHSERNAIQLELIERKVL